MPGGNGEAAASGLSRSLLSSIFCWVVADYFFFLKEEISRKDAKLISCKGMFLAANAA
jgi:hypothetical protein